MTAHEERECDPKTCQTCKAMEADADRAYNRATFGTDYRPSPMEHKGAEFARCEKNRIYFGSDGFYIEYYIDGNTQEFLRGVNAAHRRAVEEAIAGYQKDALATHEELVKEAESRVWGEAAKIAEGERVEEIGPGDDAYNTAVKHIAEALRAKAASS